jgi:hypothetical protein
MQDFPPIELLLRPDCSVSQNKIVWRWARRVANAGSAARDVNRAPASTAAPSLAALSGHVRIKDMSGQLEQRNLQRPGKLRKSHLARLGERPPSLVSMQRATQWSS